MWLYGTSAKRLIDTTLEPGYRAKTTRKYVASTCMFLFAILISLWNGVAGLVVCTGLTLLYLQAPAKPIYTDENDNEE